MAIKFLDAIDLTGLEIQNVAAQSLASNPSQVNSYAGQFIFNTGTNTFNYNDGAKWIVLDGTGNIDSVAGSTGLIANTKSGVATVSPIVSGTDNLIEAQVDGKADVLVGADSLMVSINEGKDIKKVTISQISAAAGGGTVTGVTGAAPITSSGGNSPEIGISDFTGADGTSAGTKGAVPAPAAADNVKYLKGDGTWASVPAGYAGWNLKVETEAGAGLNIGSGDVVDFIGAGGITFTRSGGVVTATSTNKSGTMSSWTLQSDSGTNQTISDGITVDMAGGEGITTVTSVNSKVATSEITLALGELGTIASPAAADKLAGVFGSEKQVQQLVAINTIPLSHLAAATADINMGGKQVTKIASTPAAADDAASKAYVDLVASGSGALIFQGGYDAANNTPVLDNRGGAVPIAVLKGWTYAVTAAGTFYGEAVEDGDLLIAEVDNAAALASWTVVQNNVGVATATVLGIANFPTAGGLAVSGGAVSLANSGVTAATKGTASKSASITVDAKGIVTSLSDQDIAIAASQVTSFCAEVKACVADTDREVVGNFGKLKSTAIAHNFKSTNVMVQCYEIATGETINVGVVRTDVNTVTLNIGKAAGGETEPYTYMIQKIGA